MTGEPSGHQGDDTSVEAVAASNPGLVVVLDPDGATSTQEAGCTPAAEVVQGSPRCCRAGPR